MPRVLILVEGQTEERFAKDVLSPSLERSGVSPIPKIVTTKRVKSGTDFKGGVTSYEKVAADLQRLLGDTDAAAITTFLDYYGLPDDFPGMNSRPTGTSSIDRACHVERSWENEVDHPRFRAYLMVHEFEALLFSDPHTICQAVGVQTAVQQLLAVRTQFDSPEDINDSPLTAPSKRLIAILPGRCLDPRPAAVR